MKRIKKDHLACFVYKISFRNLTPLFVILLFVQCHQSESLNDKTNQSEIVDSIEYYTNQITTTPNKDEVPYLRRARLYYNKNAYDAALKDLNAALQIDSSQIEIYLFKSQVEMDYFRSLEALQTLQKAENIWPDAIQIKEYLAKTHLILKQYDEARDVALQTLKINPLSAQPYLILGMVAKESKDTITAIKYLQEAVQNDADLLDGWIELARLQMEKNPGEAAQYFESALQLASDDLRIWHAYAMFRQNQDSLNQAKMIYDRIISQDSQYMEAYYNKALLLMDQDSFYGAIPVWDQYIRRSTSPAKGHYYRGISFEMTKNYHSALEDYLSARELDPTLENIEQAIKTMEDKLQ